MMVKKLLKKRGLKTSPICKPRNIARGLVKTRLSAPSKKAMSSPLNHKTEADAKIAKAEIEGSAASSSLSKITSARSKRSLIRWERTIIDPVFNRAVQSAIDKYGHVTGQNVYLLLKEAALNGELPFRGSVNEDGSLPYDGPGSIQKLTKNAINLRVRRLPRPDLAVSGGR